MRPVDAFFAVIVATIWGGNFVAARYGLAHFPPFFLTALRFASVALILVPFVPRPDRAQMLGISRIALLNTLHFSLPYVGMAMGLSIAGTAITAQLGVPFSCLLGALLLKDRFGFWSVLGMIIAFMGMTIVFGAPDILEHQTAFLCVLAGAFFWGSTNILMKQLASVGTMQMMAWMSLLSTPPLFLLSFIFEPGALSTLESVPLSPALGLAYTAIVSTILAHGLWYSLLRRCPVSQVTPYSLLTPVLGSLFALWFFGETVTSQVLIGGAVTMMGVALIVVRRPRMGELGEPV